jgi:hypothetical protein
MIAQSTVLPLDSSRCQHWGFSVIGSYSARYCDNANKLIRSGSTRVDRVGIPVWNGAHEASAEPASEPGALHRRRPWKPAGSDFNNYGEDS